MLPETVYLFQCGDTDHYALSADKTGCNLPQNGHAWLLRSEIAAGEADEALAAAVEEVAQAGFCLLDIEGGDASGG